MKILNILELLLIVVGMACGAVIGFGISLMARTSPETQAVFSIVGTVIGTIAAFGLIAFFKHLYRRQLPQEEPQLKRREFAPQVVGNRCATCEEPIMMITDGHACRVCGRFYHVSCQAELPCAKCSNEVVHAELVDTVEPSEPEDDVETHMQRAIEIAAHGRGHVEPNPMVGCVIVKGDKLVGEGFHQRHGGPHAEIEALRVAGTHAKGATMYVTLEPCCHHGKTPPCTASIIDAGIRHVVVAITDPFPQVAGGGIQALRDAGIVVTVAPDSDAAQQLIAPYLKRQSTGRPWVIAKWAMTLDGKIATRTGDSQWISGEASRAIVHQIRGRVDAIIVGRGTVEADDPLLTARPAGPRTATRIVLDSTASLSTDCQLVAMAGECPVLIVAGPKSREHDRERLAIAGCEVVHLDVADRTTQLEKLLDLLGQRGMTNVLVEGGGEVLGAFFDARAIDECHVFIAPKIIGGDGVKSPVAGIGIDQMTDALSLQNVSMQQVSDDIYLVGTCLHPED